jgi:hypothetical protein
MCSAVAPINVACQSRSQRHKSDRRHGEPWELDDVTARVRAHMKPRELQVEVSFVRTYTGAIGIGAMTQQGGDDNRVALDARHNQRGRIVHLFKFSIPGPSQATH